MVILVVVLFILLGILFAWLLLGWLLIVILNRVLLELFGIVYRDLLRVIIVLVEKLIELFLIVFVATSDRVFFSNRLFLLRLLCILARV